MNGKLEFGAHQVGFLRTKEDVRAKRYGRNIIQLDKNDLHWFKEAGKDPTNIFRGTTTLTKKSNPYTHTYLIKIDKNAGTVQYVKDSEVDIKDIEWGRKLGIGELFIYKPDAFK